MLDAPSQEGLKFAAPAGDPIQHVVLLMLENHSFDQMLGCFQRLYPHDLDGVPSGTPAPRVNRYDDIQNIEVDGRAWEHFA